MSQIRMMQMHRIHLSNMRGYAVDELESAVVWCRKLAEMYRRKWG